jgi:hypothetical protein
MTLEEMNYLQEKYGIEFMPDMDNLENLNKEQVEKQMQTLKEVFMNIYNDEGEDDI